MSVLVRFLQLVLVVAGLLLCLLLLVRDITAQAPPKCLSLAVIDSVSTSGWNLVSSESLVFLDAASDDQATVYLNVSNQPAAYDCGVSGVQYLKVPAFPWVAITQEVQAFLDTYRSLPPCPGNPGPVPRPCVLDVWEVMERIRIRP